MCDWVTPIPCSLKCTSLAVYTSSSVGRNTYGSWSYWLPMMTLKNVRHFRCRAMLIVTNAFLVSCFRCRRRSTSDLPVHLGLRTGTVARVLVSVVPSRSGLVAAGSTCYGSCWIPTDKNGTFHICWPEPRVGTSTTFAPVSLDQDRCPATGNTYVENLDRKLGSEGRRCCFTPCSYVIPQSRFHWS